MKTDIHVDVQDDSTVILKLTCVLDLWREMHVSHYKTNIMF